MSNIRQRILNLVEDSVGQLLYYDRTESESVPLGAIEQAVKDGEITVDEMVSLFQKELEAAVKRGGW